MPAFSKPLLATSALLSLIAGSQAEYGPAPVLDTLTWTPSGQFQLGDVYFCCLPEQKAFGYKKSASAPCRPGAAPILRFMQGGKYNLTIHNTCKGQVDPKTGHNFNSTNVHIHGTHTSGEGNFDNALRQVDPGNCIMQNYFIPEDHSPGTYWYHPHLHMLVYPQAGGGAFGLAIVDGAQPAQYGYDENVKAFLTNVKIERNLAVTSTGLANGNPYGTKIDLVKGQWHYLRILHVIPAAGGTAPAGFLSMARKNCEVYELATDGVFFSRVPYQKYGYPNYNYVVHAAARLDLAVRCNEGGSFAAYTFAGNTVAYFNVAYGYPGPETPFNDGKKQWTPTRPNYLSDLRDGKYPSEVVSVGPTYPVLLDDLQINGKSWNVYVPTASFPFGPKYIQEFKIMGSDEHPYHIHQQHFQVVQPGGCGLAMREGEFYDSISDTNDADCLVRLRFVDYTGKIIHHCHNLEHEDEGMMGWFDVPFAAPGSFEASSLYVPATPQFSCPVNPTYWKEANTSEGTAENACPAAPIYPWIIMGVSIAVAAVTVVVAVVMVRRSNTNVMFEEMKGPFQTPVQGLGASPCV